MGFVPKSKSKLLNFLKPIQSEEKTIVVLVSNHKIILLLETLSIIASHRKIAVCKEITKLNERVFYGLPKKILDEISANPKNTLGEFVVVIDGEKKIRNISLELENIIKRLLRKFSLTETVEIVHKISYIEKKQIYKKALEIKNENSK